LRATEQPFIVFFSFFIVSLSNLIAGKNSKEAPQLLSVALSDLIVCQNANA